MKSLLKTPFHIIVLFITLVLLSSCGDDEKDGQIKTGPAGLLKGTYIGTLTRGNEITEDVTLIIVAQQTNQISLQFSGKDLPNTQNSVFLMVDKNNNNIIIRSDNSLNQEVSIRYNISEGELKYYGPGYTFSGYHK